MHPETGYEEVVVVLQAVLWGKQIREQGVVTELAKLNTSENNCLQGCQTTQSCRN
jgi:hypothetical protein